MPMILCPVCGEPLIRLEKQYRCPSGHCFDLAKQGYVNLLTVDQKHSLHPGDTKEMVAARRAFLQGGFYAPIAQTVCEAALAFAPHAQALLDVGCGEGYYSAQVANTLHCQLFGLDISKEAVRYAAGQYKNGNWICATAARLPFEADSFDLLLSMFALTIPEEFHRVLQKSGVFLQVLAASDHLRRLKSIIYPTAVQKEKETAPAFPGFSLLESKRLTFSCTVEGAQVQNLLAMTPHFWRISKEGAQRLAETKRLEDRASIILNVYQKEVSYGAGNRI